jgi:RNA polymerase-binding transcription factor DksA
MNSVHYHYLTLEQRAALEHLVRVRSRDKTELAAALERLHQPDYGVCIECGRDIAFTQLMEDPEALHCAQCARLPVTQLRSSA